MPEEYLNSNLMLLIQTEHTQERMPLWDETGKEEGGVYRWRGPFFSITKQYFWSPGVSATPESGEELCGTEAKRLIGNSSLLMAASNN